MPILDMLSVVGQLLWIFAPYLLGYFAVYILVALLTRYLRRRARAQQGPGETAQERIERLVGSLKESIQLISDIEEEINQRQVLVTRLREDVSKYDQLSKLKQSEANAVAQLVQGEIRKEGQRSFWQGLGINFIFFLLGIVVSIFVRGM